MRDSFTPIEAVLTRLGQASGTRKKAGRPQGGFCEAKVLRSTNEKWRKNGVQRRC